MGLSGERVIIFGGTGSLGRALINRLNNRNQLSIFSRDEAKHWTIKNQLNLLDNISFYVGDIRDFKRVKEVLEKSNPTIIMIASALKQVDTCEVSPLEGIKTNSIGANNICEAVVELGERLQNLKSVLLVSTDKACAPTNVYGMSKSIAERIVTSYFSWNPKVKFVSVRYGNVLESRGSIIPLFKYQVETRRKLTVTDKRMTRFMMTLKESIDLIEATLADSASGEIWIPKIPALKIIDLAEIFSERFDIGIEIIGMRPGEKLHEDLISEPESIRTKSSDKYFIIENSMIVNSISSSAELFTFSSNHNVLSKNTLESKLDKLGIFDMKNKDFVGREIEEIRTN